MLAQSFKTADELGLSEKQKDALIKTLVLFETEGVTHQNLDGRRMPNDSAKSFTGHFNMLLWNSPEDCGTVCCIGGTAELISGVEFDRAYLAASASDKHFQLSALFYPRSASDWNSITVAQAATALRNYLTTGKPDWQYVVSD